MKNLNPVKPIILSIFRGEKTELGKIQPQQRVGKCLFYQETGSHVIHIDVLPGTQNTFFLKTSSTPGKDYAICTKEAMRTEPGKNLFREVGAATLCKGLNEGLLNLEWYFFGANNIYLQTLTTNMLTEKVSA